MSTSQLDGSTGSKHNLVIGLSNVDVQVLMVTTLTNPSPPGCSCKTLASGQLFGENLSSFISTIELCFIKSFDVHHLVRTWDCFI